MPDSREPATSVRHEPAALRQSMLRRLPKRLFGTGRLRVPAVPALVDHYVEQLGSMFALHGRKFTETELEHVRGILKEKLKEGWDASPYSHVIVRFQTDDPPKTSLSYWVSVEVSTIENEYATWVATRTPPLFGTHPDSKVMDLCHSLGTDAPVLDIGAGTGRNTLPMARAGHPTSAVELSPDLARILRTDAEKEGLTVQLFEGDVLNADLDLPESHFRLIILCEVVSHFRSAADLRRLFERTARLLAPGGLLAFSVFLPVSGYQPDRLAFELSQVFWSTLYTREELKEASDGLGFSQLSEESVHDYEKKRLPESAWPPTGWFVEWTRGIDIYNLPVGKAPVDMRWVVYKKS
ncbi:MAG TPA: class I SAM-dependent methyltransferase [Polyangiaceae bacterium]